ncbi:MAG: helix-turn-helix domain-containing protein, partial [Verrucomicrobiota bacterium]
PDFRGEVSMPEAISSLGKWLKGLPKPAGVFVFFDGWARWVLDACVLEDLKVPQEVSVLGVDNDRWLCELSQPRLSSVDPNITTAGFMAAKILDGMLKGRKAPDLTTIDPVGVEGRDSTDYMAFEESKVVTAIRYIREHACDPITPADVLAVTGMSSSTAYRKFMKELGHSVHTEIQRVQLARVKELLTTTNLSVTEVGVQAGFDNVGYFTKVFRDAFGCTPKHYRKTQGTAGI